MTRYGMLVKAYLCIGCKICTYACKDEFEGNAYPTYSAPQPDTTASFGPSFYPSPSSLLSLQVNPGQEWIQVKNQVSGMYPSVTSKWVPFPCMQCDNPPCVAAATNNAVYVRPDKIVLIDPEKSVGQDAIPPSCPYGVIFWNNSALLPQKCTFCAHLVDQGKNPKCVDSCPVSALEFGDLDNPSSNISKDIASLNAQPLHPEYGTKPKVYYSGL